MFGQMRTRNRVLLPPCPCNNTCVCHLPRQNKLELRILLGIIIFSVVSGVILIYYAIKNPIKNKEQIEVNGEMCEIQYHRDCYLPLSCGHKVAICK